MASRASASRRGPGSRGSPVDDMIDVSVRTRSGWWIASSCAIAPPIDAPTTCAVRMRSASSSPTVSAAMSRNVYGMRNRRPVTCANIISAKRGVRASGKRVDMPMSRLSKRITQKPRAASRRQNSWSHTIICAARPMMSTSGGALRSPNVS